MTLASLLEEIDVDAVNGPVDLEVSGLCSDSRRVSPGAVFFGLAGQREDGGRFARQALAAGAAAVVVGRGSEIVGRTVVEVAEPRLALAQAAARFHGHPERALRIVAVTGTNGKTTTTWMLESVFRACGWRAGIIGTTGVRLGDEQRPSELTTPDSIRLYGLLGEMVERGITGVAIEVSSHALSQRRVFGLACEVAVFTNLSHDHLDYHGTMERYLDAKLMLFDGRNGRAPERGFAVVNADDAKAGAVIAAAERGGLQVVRYGLGAVPRSPATELDVGVMNLAPDAAGLAVQFRAGVANETRVGGASPARGGIAVRVPLLGRHNALNAAAAFAAAIALRLPLEAIVRGLESMPAVPGRLERVDAGQPFLVVVDYAHTPDALERALASAREHGTGRVLLVFGCGGDRDRGKRPVMGRVAGAASDLAWVTNDNPRGEDPAAIAAEIMAGTQGGRLEVELDRRAAIEKAISAARPGDVVLIAGKGHETTQTVGACVVPFDDRAVAREVLSARRGAL